MPGFDLISVLQSRGYPEDSTVIYLDERIAQKIGKLRAKITETELSVEEMEKVQEELAEATDEAKKVAYTVHATGRARQVYRDADKEARKKHPANRNFAGQIEQDDDYDEAFNSLLWVAQITKIIDPDGNELVEPDLKQIEALRNNAPSWSLNQIEALLQKLRDAGTDFEFVSQSEDFS